MNILVVAAHGFTPTMARPFVHSQAKEYVRRGIASARSSRSLSASACPVPGESVHLSRAA